MRSWCYLWGQGVSIELIKCGALIFPATVVTWWPSILRLQAPTKNQRVMSLLHFPGPFLFVFLGPLGAFTPHPTRAAVNPNAGPCGPMRRARISDPDFTSCTGHQMTSKLAVQISNMFTITSWVNQSRLKLATQVLESAPFCVCGYVCREFRRLSSVAQLVLQKCVFFSGWSDGPLL